MPREVSMHGIWLVLETSGRVARVGLARAGQFAQRAELDSGRRHARELVPLIDTMLKAESLRPTDLTGVIAARGPGSYTGLRVGLATAKTLAYALGCEFRAVDTFAAIAHQSPACAHSVWVIADALQGLVYAQSFARRHDDWLPSNPLRILSADEFAVSLASNDLVSGPGVAVHEGQIPQLIQRVPESDREARVESVLAVGLRFVEPLTKEELFTLEPLYLRGSSAEEKAKSAPRD